MSLQVSQLNQIARGLKTVSLSVFNIDMNLPLTCTNLKLKAKKIYSIDALFYLLEHNLNAG